METTKLSRPQKIELYTRLVTAHPDAVLKGDTVPYTSLNGHMYSFLTKDDVVALRLPEDEKVKFMEKYNTGMVQQYGIVQTKYVVVPDSLLQNGDEVAPYFDLSYRHTGSLKPKATAKSKKKD